MQLDLKNSERSKESALLRKSLKHIFLRMPILTNLFII